MKGIPCAKKQNTNVSRLNSILFIELLILHEFDDDIDVYSPFSGFVYSRIDVAEGVSKFQIEHGNSFFISRMQCADIKGTAVFGDTAFVL